MKKIIRRIKPVLRRLHSLYRQRMARPQRVACDLLYSIDTLSYGELDSLIQLDGWAVVAANTTLALELDGRRIADIRPNLPRPDVLAVRPDIPASVTPGFSLQIKLQADWFNGRGASRLQVCAIIDGCKHVLTDNPVFIRQHYPETLQPQDMQASFYFTVGSSNISLGGFGDFQEKLSPFAIGACRLGFMVPLLYMRSTQGAARDWNFAADFDERQRQSNGKPVIADSLHSIMEFARQRQLPCVIGLNGGIWSDASGTCPEWDLVDHLEEDPANCQWNQHNQVMPDDHLKHLTGAEHAPELSRALTLNHYNEQVRRYKKRNLQQAAAAILDFARQHPGLYIGSNLDPDCYQNPFFEGEQWYDYNPQTLQQFRDWLAGTGAYQAELRHTLTHSPYSLPALNDACGTRFDNWQQVEPPREHPSKPVLGQPDRLLQLWETFRRHSVHRHYSDLASWLVEAGLSPAQIFSSQGFTAPRFTSEPFALQLDSPLKNYDSGGMSLAGSKPEQGHIGAILYGESARNNIRTENGKPFFQNIYERDTNWAVVEFNPADLRDPPKQLPDYAFAWDCLRQIFNHGARYLNLMAWNGNTAKDIDKDYFNAHMALRDTPLEAAVIDFMLIHADVPRGSVCYSFGSNKHACSEGWSSPDIRLEAHADGLHLTSGGWLLAPQPYLLAGKSYLDIRMSSVGDIQPAMALKVNGQMVMFDCKNQPDGNTLRISFQPLPDTLQSVELCVEFAAASAPLVLQRLVFG